MYNILLKKLNFHTDEEAFIIIFKTNNIDDLTKSYNIFKQIVDKDQLKIVKELKISKIK